MELTFTSLHKITSAAVEKACKTAGLNVTMKTSLKTLPDNEHWHFKKGKLPGVLEITCMLKAGNLVFSCKKGRRGDWIDSAIVEISQTLNLFKV